MALILYRIYQVLIMLPLAFVATLLASLITIAGCLLGGSRIFSYYPAHIWAKICCWLSFVKVTVNGRENIDKNTSYVFVANHQGAYDIFAIYGFLNHNFKWMMKIGLMKIPMVGYACKCAGQIFVDNSSQSAVRRTMEAAERQLSRGMSVVVFPEGSRTLDGKMHAFKRGAYQLAMEFNLPVTPITIDGAYEVMRRRGPKLPHWGHITLTIHKPIHAPEDGHELKSLLAESFDAIHSALPECHK